jgi:hypothetical protein
LIKVIRSPDGHDMTLRKIIALAVLLIAGLGWYFSPAGVPEIPVDAAPGAPGRETGFAPGKMVAVQGTVERLLADDRDGSPHQRFVIRTASGRTLLVAHNLDLAARLDGLGVGDSVSLYGEYAWNDRGGLIHWTHHDPNGTHAAGYIDWKGRRYQ